MGASNSGLVSSSERRALYDTLIHNEAALEQRYRLILRRTLFSARAFIRPRDMLVIARAEVAAYFQYLLQHDDSSVIGRGAALCKRGLSEEALLDLGNALRLYCHENLDNDHFPQGLSIVDNYHALLVGGFIQRQAALIMEEQELIRSALHRTVTRNAMQMELAADVARAATSVLELDDLLNTSARLIRERFDLHTDVYLLDEAGRRVTLRASATEEDDGASRIGLTLAVDEQSLVGWCACHGRSRNILNVNPATIHMDETLLPDSRSVLVLPLMSRGGVIGVMTIQSSRAAALGDPDMTVLQTMADILGNAIANASLYKEVQRHAADLEELVRERTRDLEAAQEELVLRERLATLGHLTVVLSHELRNPLATIRSSHYYVAQRTKDKGLKVERALDRSERNIIRCNKIIEDLLEHTRDTPLAPRPTPIDDWLDDLLGDLGVPSWVVVVPDLSSGQTLPFDRERFRRCMVNIVNNACEAMMDDDSRPITRPDGSRCDQLHIATRVQGRWLLVLVRDDGIGIPQDQMEKIFEPLYSTKSFGVGLGLAIVKQIVQQHSGRISIHSTPGEGSTVEIALPLDGGIC